VLSWTDMHLPPSNDPAGDNEVLRVSPRGWWYDVIDHALHLARLRV